MERRLRFCILAALAVCAAEVAARPFTAGPRRGGGCGFATPKWPPEALLSGPLAVSSTIRFETNIQNAVTALPASSFLPINMRREILTRFCEILQCGRKIRVQGPGVYY